MAISARPELQHRVPRVSVRAGPARFESRSAKRRDHLRHEGVPERLDIVGPVRPRWLCVFTWSRNLDALSHWPEYNQVPDRLGQHGGLGQSDEMSATGGA